MDIYESKEYKRSRLGYIMYSAFGYFVSLIVTDAYLAKLLSYIGFSDALIGVVSSIATFSSLCTIPSIFLSHKITNTKWTAIPVLTLHLLMFMSIYTVPFMNIQTQSKIILVIIFISIAYALNSFFGPIMYKWANTSVHPWKIAEFSAVNEIVSSIGAILFTLLMGFMFDRFEKSGNLPGGFMFAAGTIFLLTIFNNVALLMMRNSDEDKKKSTIRLSDIIENTIYNKGFRNITILTCLWNIAQYMTIGFLGIYKTKELMFSVATIQLLNIIASFARVLVSIPFGRYSDKNSFLKGIKLAIYIAATSYIAGSFTTPDTRWLIAIYGILNACCLAGTNQNMMLITYSYVKDEYVSQALALKNCIGGVCGFGASLVAGKILSAVQANGNMLFGIHIYPQQLLSFISFIICLAIIPYISYVEKQK